MIKRAQQDEKIDAISDKFSTPTYTHDIARMLPQFFDRGVEGGILHFANAGKCSWQEYAQRALDCCHDAGIPLKARTVGALQLSEMTNWVARRPVYSVLSTAKYTELTGTAPRAWREAVADYITRFYSKK
jgi:dTDP-4-dehydrorhamnose reductase